MQMQQRLLDRPFVLPPPSQPSLSSSAPRGLLDCSSSSSSSTGGNASSGSSGLEEDLPVLLAWYAEDVTRLVEKEVKDAEFEIRARFPEAAFIELEPDSTETNKLAGAFKSSKRQQQRLGNDSGGESGVDRSHNEGSSEGTGAARALAHARGNDGAAGSDRVGAGDADAHNSLADDFESNYDETRRTEEEAFRRALVDLASVTEAAAASKRAAVEAAQEELRQEQGGAKKEEKGKKEEEMQ